MSEGQLKGLEQLRAPFEAHQISALPKPTKAQTDAVKANFREGIRCTVCGTWHHKDVVHLDYVGHAAVTDRLLTVDPMWNWEPLAEDERGLPVIDSDGGLWIKLTVLGVTRLGYGDAQSKKGPDAMKERIGDALRNAAMRFGVALDLWHKGILHMDVAEEDDTPAPEAPAAAAAKKMPITGDRFKTAMESIRSGEFTVAKLRKNFELSTDQETAVADLEAELAKAKP